VGNEDGTISLWSLASRTLISTLSPAGSQSATDLSIDELTFSPNGSLLIGTDSGGVATTLVDPWQMWLFANPYAAICDEVGPPTAQTWAQDGPGLTEPSGTCAGVPPASQLGG
jgi:hypothetical protein